MAELKTQKTNASVEDFLNSIENPSKKADSFVLLELFKKVTNEEPHMWGTSIVGFGQYHYKSERSRQEGDWLVTGFSPRKQNLTLYVMPAFGVITELLPKLGKHKVSVGCLYINKVQDIDLNILEEIIARSVKALTEHYQKTQNPPALP